MFPRCLGYCPMKTKCVTECVTCFQFNVRIEALQIVKKRKDMNKMRRKEKL